MTHPHPQQLPPPGPSATQAQAAVQAALRRIGQALADAHREVHAAVTMLAPTHRATAEEPPAPVGDARLATPSTAGPSPDEDALGLAVEAAAHAQEQAEKTAHALAEAAEVTATQGTAGSHTNGGT
jgi:hypothetical protein